MTDITQAFLEAIPKSDLHVHLDGSMRLSTLIELAREYDVELPSYTEDGLCDLVFKDRYNDLGEYLHGFKYTVAVLQSEIALERVAFELAEDNIAEGVRYIEVRFAPQLHAHKHLGLVQVMKAVNRGLARATAAFNARPEVTSGAEPPFAYGIIVCAMRMFQAGFSEYYANLLSVHQYLPRRLVYGFASAELARAAIVARDQHHVPIVAIDLAGQERGYPAEDHVEAFMFAHRNFLCKTVHAGEAYGPESIFQALTLLHADRLGHGFFLIDSDMVTDPEIPDREAFVAALLQHVADRRITIEICLTSNYQTIPHLEDLAEHPLRQFRDLNLSIAICTDNRTVSHTSVTQELRKAIESCGFDRSDIKHAVVYGFKRSFYPRAYASKRAWVRRLIDYYEAVERRFYGADATPSSIIADD